MTRAIGLAIAVLAACGSTGGNLVSFEVVARGASPKSGATPGVYDTSLGWHVELASATLYIGAVYLNQTRPNSGIQGTDCILPGVYTGEELQGRTVDALSAAAQPFPVTGTGTDDEALTGEVWLTHGDVNAAIDGAPIARITGTATQGAQVRPFSATIQIDSANRGIPSPLALPSQHPICKQRIVSPIFIDLRPHDGGTLAITVDPSGWFDAIDFATLPADGVFSDDNTSTASAALFSAIRAATTTFQFSFE